MTKMAENWEITDTVFSVWFSTTQFNFSPIQFWWLDSRKPESAGMDRRLFMWQLTYQLPENQEGDWFESF